MASPLKHFAARAFARPGMKKAYRELADEFAFIDEVLRARAAAGLTQAEVSARVGTTESAIAKLEAAHTKHSPSLATHRAFGRLDHVQCITRERSLGSTTRSERRRFWSTSNSMTRVER